MIALLLSLLVGRIARENGDYVLMIDAVDTPIKC